MKKVYYLKDDSIRYYQDFPYLDDLIVWSYEWDGHIIYSTALIEMTNKYYYEN